MTQIQIYQINQTALSGFVQNIATGSSVANNYLSTGNLIAGTGIQLSISGQNVIINSTITGGNIGSGSGIVSPNSYFGYTGFSISGAGTWSGNLNSGQGILTTRVDILSGGIYTGNFIVGSTNAFAGAISRYKFRMLGGTGANISISGYGSSIVINQQGLSGNTDVYFEYGFDGSKWNVDVWI